MAATSSDAASRGAERQPDEKRIEWIGFPGPPHRIEGGRGKIALLALRLGPEAAWAALDSSRKQFARP